jgi:hypothetical protein
MDARLFLGIKQQGSVGVGRASLRHVRFKKGSEEGNREKRHTRGGQRERERRERSVGRADSFFLSKEKEKEKKPGSKATSSSVCVCVSTRSQR